MRTRYRVALTIVFIAAASNRMDAQERTEPDRSRARPVADDSLDNFLTPKLFELLATLVENAGEVVRISVQLVRATDGFSAWSSRFDRRLDDIFSVQDEIAGMIVQTVTHRVGKVSGPLVTSTTSNTQAYSLYLEGRYLWNKRPGDVVWQALDRFERAIAIDPNFAPAHAALAGVYGAVGAWEFGVMPPSEALVKAKAAAARALERDPKLAEGHTSVGYTTLHFDWDPDAACREFDHAIALNPAWTEAHHWHSHAGSAESADARPPPLPDGRSNDWGGSMTR